MSVLFYFWESQPPHPTSLVCIVLTSPSSSLSTLHLPLCLDYVLTHHLYLVSSHLPCYSQNRLDLPFTNQFLAPPVSSLGQFDFSIPLHGPSCESARFFTYLGLLAIFYFWVGYRACLSKKMSKWNQNRKTLSYLLLTDYISPKRGENESETYVTRVPFARYQIFTGRQCVRHEA